MGDDLEGRRLARFFDLSVDLLAVVGYDGIFRRVNPAWERTLGYPTGEIRGRHWTELIHPGDREPTQQQGRHEGQNAVMFFENRYRHKDGSFRWLQWSVIRVPEEEVFYAAARDVTQQREAAEQLRASEGYKTAILRSAMDALVTIDNDGLVVDFNPAAERMYGYRAEQVRGRPFADFAIPPEERAAYRADVARLTERDGTIEVRVEHVGMRADGSRFPLELTVTRLGGRGQARFAGFIRDLTASKRAEAQRRKLEEQLRQAQKMEAVGRLAGGVAHDFNNLLSVILGFSDFASAGLPPDAPGRESLEEVKKAAQRATTLVRQLLAFSRRQLLSPKVLDVGAGILDLERVLRGMAGELIELELALAPDVGRVKVDPGQLEQVLVNLAMNGRDAMPDGGRLRISTANVDLDEARIPPGLDARPGAYVRITVEDTGVGMSDEVAARVFEPFFTTKETGSGSGLGLSTVYGIVTQSGGLVTFKTAPGRGTTFEVFLPRVEAPEDAVPRPVVAQGSAPRPRTGETVLLVEDEEAVRQLVRKILEQRGYKVLLARHGGEALDVCRQTETPIHLLLTDAVMPVLSGPELLRRAIELRPEMKLAIMSGYSDRPTVSGIPFIPKPFTPAELDRRIREILDANGDAAGRPGPRR
jgi:PAS domain S-box-containing protein